ncbi:MAG: hypothetical protein AAB638_02890 [Patescibacteria group bacterium]
MNLLIIVVVLLLLVGREKLLNELHFLNEKGKKVFGPILWIILLVLIVLYLL